MEPKIRERPILFSAPMVRAILAGTKTQTRRAIKQQPLRAHQPDIEGYSLQDFSDNPDTLFDHKHVPCPYGQPGDRLYVRETWRVGARWDDSKPSDIPPNICTVLYKAGGFTTNGDNGERIHGGECSNPDWAGKTRTAIHMPRWASRIDLEITGVRVERLNAISEADAAAEGIIKYDMGGHGPLFGTGYPDTDPCARDTPVGAYAALWESINGAGSWDANPWVWVVEFQRVGQRSKV